jgi:hypothetical protein
MKAVKAELEKNQGDRVAEFEKGAQTFAKKVVANFKDYEFVCFSYPSFFAVGSQHTLQYTGETMNPDGMVALLNYREDGVTRKGSPFLALTTFNGLSVAYFTFWKDGLKEIKL